MNDRTDLPLESQLAAALDWWRSAGVDCSYEDEARSWLQASATDAGPSGPAPAPATATQKAERPVAPQPPRIGGDPAGWPRDLPGFREWWLTEPSLDLGGNRRRMAPRGEASAALMIVVPMPEEADRENLLSAREGLLVANMLAAMSLNQDAVYLAAALPTHLAEPDWASLARDGLGAVLLHHIALVRPRRLLVLGQRVLPLLGHTSAQAPATVKQTEIHAGETSEYVPTLVGVAPGLLLDNARQRAMLWRRWLEWTDADR